MGPGVERQESAGRPSWPRCATTRFNGAWRLVHRWLRAEQADPIELLDAWLERREPSADLRYAPVDPMLWAPRTRRAWEDEIRASEHRVDGEGRVIRPERGDIALIGWAIVWVPRRAVVERA